MNKKKKEKKKISFLIYLIFLIFLISFFLNLILIIFIFLGYFIHFNSIKKDYIEKTINDDDIKLYLQKYNNKNKTQLKLSNLQIKENKYKHTFPNIIIFSFHGSHETILEKSQIKITDRIINYYKEYSNVKIYAINYYSKIIFPTEKGIKKNAIRIVQNIIDNELYEQKNPIFYHIGFDCWSLGTCVGLYTINNIKLKKYMSIKFIDLRTPPLNLYNVAYKTANYFLIILFPCYLIFQYDDFFNNKTQIQNLITKYPYISIYFYIPENDDIIDIKEQNKLFDVVNYKYIRNIKQFKKGKTHSSDYVLYGLQEDFI